MALIIGYSGACRREELTNLKCSNMEFKEDKILVSISKTKNYMPRLFAITNKKWIDIIKIYSKLRPAHAEHDRFFINYIRGKCTVQPIGLNKIGNMPKVIAKYLKLPNAELYLGHCFRRTSATHLANHGGDLLTVKRHGGWKSSAVAEGYIDASIQKRIEVSKMLQNKPICLEQEAESQPGCSHTFDVTNSSTSVEQTVPGGVTLNTAANCQINLNVYNNCTFNK